MPASPPLYRPTDQASRPAASPAVDPVQPSSPFSGPLLELDRDQLRAAAWELGHTVCWVRAAMRERLDGFVVNRRIGALCMPTRDAPIWYDEITPPPQVVAQDILTVLLDEQSTLSAVERAAAARVVGQSLQHMLAQVSAAVDHCARLDDHIDAGRNLLDVTYERRQRLDAYRPFHPVPERSIPRVTNESFSKLVPVDLIATAMASTSITTVPGRLLQEMKSLEQWAPDWSPSAQVSSPAPRSPAVPVQTVAVPAAHPTASPTDALPETAPGRARVGRYSK